MDESDDPRWELANALTHGAGAVAALAGAAVLIVAASMYGGTMEIVSSAVFSATMVLLYTASTLYHAAKRPELKARLKVFDHCAIYLLIAGSYTPFTLIGLRGGWGWSLFGVAWGLAVAGVVFKLFFTGRFPRISTAIYVGMGWMAHRRHQPHAGAAVRRPRWRGWWRAAWRTPRAPSSTSTAGRTRTPCGTCSCWPAACATSPP